MSKPRKVSEGLGLVGEVHVGSNFKVDKKLAEEVSRIPLFLVLKNSYSYYKKNYF